MVKLTPSIAMRRAAGVDDVTAPVVAGAFGDGLAAGAFAAGTFATAAFAGAGAGFAGAFGAGFAGAGPGFDAWLRRRPARPRTTAAAGYGLMARSVSSRTRAVMACSSAG